MLECTAINVDGLDLISDRYYFTLQGLFTNDINVVSNELFTDGISYNRTKIREKKPLLNGFIRTRDINDFMTLRQVLLKRGLKTFIVSIPGFPQISFQAELQNWGEGPLGSFTISCQLIIPDPNLYAATAQNVTLGAVSNSSLVFPITFPVTFGSISGGQGTITNIGNTISYPVITIVGTCDSITISNNTTGETMSLNISLQDSDTLLVDNTPSNRGIYLNNVKRMDLKQGSWFRCVPGDNLFTFSRNSLQVKQHCTISLQSRWL